MTAFRRSLQIAACFYGLSAGGLPIAVSGSSLIVVFILAAPAFSNGSGRFTLTNGAGVVRSGSLLLTILCAVKSAVGSSNEARSTAGRARIGNNVRCFTSGASSFVKSPTGNTLRSGAATTSEAKSIGTRSTGSAGRWIVREAQTYAQRPQSRLNWESRVGTGWAATVAHLRFSTAAARAEVSA